MNDTTPVKPTRKPGERKAQILQTLATMLENPKTEKITTALLAERVQVSEAALYRHFASKAQMYEGLIEFIEASLFGLINQIMEQHDSGRTQTIKIVQVLVAFAEKNRGMTRVLVGEAIIYEQERLQQRITQLLSRVESSLKQSIRMAMAQEPHLANMDAAAVAALLTDMVLGKWLRFVKSGFKVMPSDHLEAQILWALP